MCIDRKNCDLFTSDSRRNNYNENTSDQSRREELGKNTSTGNMKNSYIFISGDRQELDLFTSDMCRGLENPTLNTSFQIQRSTKITSN